MYIYLLEMIRNFQLQARDRLHSFLDMAYGFVLRTVSNSCLGMVYGFGWVFFLILCKYSFTVKYANVATLGHHFKVIVNLSKYNITSFKQPPV